MSFCPNANCVNYGRVSREWPNDLYNRGSMEKKGTQRFECRACGRTFSSLKPADYERNIRIAILRMLIGGRNLKEISSSLNLSTIDLNAHIDAISKKLQEFESNMLSKAEILNEIASGDLEGVLLVSSCPNTDYLVEIIQQKNNSGMNSLEKITSPQAYAHLRKKVLPWADLSSDHVGDVLNIHRLWFNFKIMGLDGKTPAMRAGITDEGIDFAKRF